MIDNRAPPDGNPHASPGSYFERYPVPERSERNTLRSLAEQADELIVSEPPGHISQPSAEYDHYLETGEGLEHATDPPGRELCDTERPPPGETTLPRPTPRPEFSEYDPDVEVGEVELIPGQLIRSALARLEKTVSDCANQVLELKQVIALLPCMKEDVTVVKCPSLVPAE
jgi:hypothetical protein